jgi:hypothetical protein
MISQTSSDLRTKEFVVSKSGSTRPVYVNTKLYSHESCLERVSCEENGRHGFVWQTYPTGFLGAQRTEVVPAAGNYESFAFDDRGGGRRPTFFTTEDTKTGPVVRFIPDDNAMDCFNSPTPSDRWCTLSSGSHSFLQLSKGDCQSGTFSWDGANREQGSRYPNAEGIDCRGMFSLPQRVLSLASFLNFLLAH